MFNSVLDEVLRIFDSESYLQDEKLKRLSSLKRHCENWLAKEFERTLAAEDADACVYVCDFAKLQFPGSQEQRSSMLIIIMLN
jgi:hypothetical protein